MPIVDTGFVGEDGKPDLNALLAFGPTVQVTVSHIPANAAANSATDTVHGLIDTGAAQSCIDTELAIKLGLPVVDVQKIAGAGGAAEHDVYMAKVEIPTLNIHQMGQFTGVKLSDGGQAHRVLLGRTFLQGTIMIYDGIKGQVTLTSKF